MAFVHPSATAIWPCTGIALAAVDSRLSIAVYTVAALIWLIPDRRLERTIRASSEQAA